MPAFWKQLEKNRNLCGEDCAFHDRQYRTAQEELAGIEKKLESLLDAMSLPQSQEAKLRITRRMETLLESGEHIRRHMEELTALEARGSLSPETFDALLRDLGDFVRCTAEMPLEEKRRALRETVEKVIWDGRNARILLANSVEKTRQRSG
jgi:hypothetical protein